MTQPDLDKMGPIDYVVVEFPPGRQHFTGEMAHELARLHDSGAVRVLDVLVPEKADDGTVNGFELDDLDEMTVLEDVERRIAEILAAEDVAHVGRRI